jgi:AcrR family transcriptional regulator
MIDRAPARERLLKAAAELFYKNGVSATGIDAITTHAGVAKMSLYNNFASKAELVNAYITARNEEWLALYEERVKAASTPRERILTVFDVYAEHAALALPWGFRGCGLLNAAAELPVGDPARAAVAAQKAGVEALFRQHLTAMGAAQVEETAEHLSFLLEGAMSRAGLEGHDARLKAARRIAVSILAVQAGKAAA